MKVNLQQLNGNWNWGKSLDIHTISSTPVLDENGNIARWDTERTEIGEELYKLKYYTSENSRIKYQRVNSIATEMNTVISSVITHYSAKFKNPFVINHIIAVPPSKSRSFQPVPELAKKVAELSNISLDLVTLKKTKSTSQLKKIEDHNEREKILEDAFEIEDNVFKNQNVLLIDDLYRSGATLKAITKVIKEKGKARNVLVLTATKTRSKR